MNNAMKPNVVEDDDEIDLAALLRTIWNGRWIVLLCMFLMVLAGAYYALRVAVPMYPAQATVALETSQVPVISDIESIFSGGGTDTTQINTEIEVFRSRQLIGQLVDELDLVEDPEFNSALSPPSLQSRAIGTVRDGLTAVFGLAGMSVGQPQTDGTLSEPQPRNRVIDTVINRLSVSNIRQSLAFSLSIATTDPVKSARVVNTLAELYVENQIQQKLKARTRAIEFLSQRTSELETNVARLEENLAERIEQSQIASDEVLQAQNQRLRDLRNRIADQQERLSRTAALLEEFDGADTPEDFIATAISVGGSRFAGTIRRLENGQISQDAASRSVQSTLVNLRDDLERERAQVQTLQASAKELSERISRQTSQLQAIEQLRGELQSARLLYETFFNRLQEANVQQGLETANSRVLSEAVPRPASSPQVMRILALCAILGAMLGAAIVLIREWRYAGFRTPDDLRNALGRRMLGAVPKLRTRGRRENFNSIKSSSESRFAEAVRNIRTSVLMANVDRGAQVILLSSALPAEGKTTLSLSLARSLAGMEGKRILLIEADIRRRVIQEYVTSEMPTSITDIVMGETELDEVDLYNEELGFEVLPGAETELNAADLFASKRFKQFLEDLRERYDHIIVDSPPVLAVPDARILADYADALVFVVLWASTTQMQVRQAVEMVESSGNEITGFAMTQVDLKKLKSYGYGSRYGYYVESDKYYHN